MGERTNFEALGDRMKAFEMQEAGRKLIQGVPVVARLDGRSFHTFTKGMAVPYHMPFREAMHETAKFLVEQVNAEVAYTQSDEITLVFWNLENKQVLPFDARVQKLCSVLAGLATAKFNQEVVKRMPEKANMLPVFDCRVWNIPEEHLVDVVAWRVQDAVKNSITMAASAYYSHKELHKKTSSDKHELLHKVGVNWNDYPQFFKEGCFFKRVTVMKTLAAEELSRIPEKHRPTGPVARTEVQCMNWPRFHKIANKQEVLFSDTEPQVVLLPEADFMRNNG